MRKIRILLCDDDIGFMQSVQFIIEKDFPNKFILDQVTDENFSLSNAYDVYFIDIEMPKISGFEIAKLIKKKNPKAFLIFLTTHEELSMQGYEYQAFRFISKHKLNTTLDKTLSAIIYEISKNNEFISAKREDGIVDSVFIVDVIIIMAEGNYLTLLALEHTYRKRIKLKELAMKVDLSKFICTERGILVNVRHIIQYNQKQYELTLINNKKMIIGRKYRRDFIENYLSIRSSFLDM